MGHHGQIAGTNFWNTKTSLNRNLLVISQKGLHVWKSLMSLTLLNKIYEGCDGSLQSKDNSTADRPWVTQQPLRWPCHRSHSNCPHLSRHIRLEHWTLGESLPYPCAPGGSVWKSCSLHQRRKLWAQCHLQNSERQSLTQSKPKAKCTPTLNE